MIFASTWGRHQMETFSALLALCAGNSPVIGEFPAQRPVTRSFYVFLDMRLNKRLCKQSWDWWFETPSCPLWRHCNESPCHSIPRVHFYTTIPYCLFGIIWVSWTLYPFIPYWFSWPLNICIYLIEDQHIEAEKKLPPFSRRQFHMDSINEKYRISIIEGPIYNIPLHIKQYWIRYKRLKRLPLGVYV